MVYQFAHFELDPERFELRRAGEAVAVEPQVLSLLILLVGNRGRMVSKDEIYATVWNGRIVSEAALSSRIRSARKILGDSGKEQRFIRTVHGSGLRFVAPVTTAETMESCSGSAAGPGPPEAAPPEASVSRPTVAALPFQRRVPVVQHGFRQEKALLPEETGAPQPILRRARESGCR
ncbi:hypothetical protein BH23VER1_BH23VER1_35080 [soil metagenome]